MGDCPHIYRADSLLGDMWSLVTNVTLDESSSARLGLTVHTGIDTG